MFAKEKKTFWEIADTLMYINTYLKLRYVRSLQHIQQYTTPQNMGFLNINRNLFATLKQSLCYFQLTYWKTLNF